MTVNYFEFCITSEFLHYNLASISWNIIIIISYNECEKQNPAAQPIFVVGISRGVDGWAVSACEFSTCEYSPMAAAHTRPQMVQLWECEVTLTPAFRLSLFSCRSEMHWRSKLEIPIAQKCLHSERSWAVVSQVAGSILHSWRLFFNKSLYRFTGRPQTAARGQLAIEDGLRKSRVRHANQMDRPAKLCLSQKVFNSGYLAAL